MARMQDPRQRCAGLLCAILFPLAAMGVRAQTPAVPANGPRAEFLRELGILEQHYVRLAEAMPPEKYAWRPNADTRSVSEAFLHAVAVNFGTARTLGVPLPEGLNLAALEKDVTQKAQVVAYLRKSFAQVRQAVLNFSDADMEKKLTLPTRETTNRGMLFTLARHLGEHLGQSIAYARVNGVVPPWTEEQQRQQPPPKPAEKPKS